MSGMYAAETVREHEPCSFEHTNEIYSSYSNEDTRVCELVQNTIHAYLRVNNLFEKTGKDIVHDVKHMSSYGVPARVRTSLYNSPRSSETTPGDAVNQRNAARIVENGADVKDAQQAGQLERLRKVEYDCVKKTANVLFASLFKSSHHFCKLLMMMTSLNHSMSNMRQ